MTPGPGVVEQKPSRGVTVPRSYRLLYRTVHVPPSCLWSLPRPIPAVPTRKRVGDFLFSRALRLALALGFHSSERETTSDLVMRCQN